MKQDETPVPYSYCNSTYEENVVLVVSGFTFQEDLLLPNLFRV